MLSSVLLFALGLGSDDSSVITGLGVSMNGQEALAACSRGIATYMTLWWYDRAATSVGGDADALKDVRDRIAILTTSTYDAWIEETTTVEQALSECLEELVHSLAEISTRQLHAPHLPGQRTAVAEEDDIINAFTYSFRKAEVDQEQEELAHAQALEVMRGRVTGARAQRDEANRRQHVCLADLAVCQGNADDLTTSRPTTTTTEGQDDGVTKPDVKDPRDDDEGDDDGDDDEDKYGKGETTSIPDDRSDRPTDLKTASLEPPTKKAYPKTR